jgi:hypothetical protein
MNNGDHILHGLGYGAVYTGLGLVLLALSYLMLDLRTPGKLGAHLHRVQGPAEQPTQASYGAGVVAAAWLLGHGLVIFTAIWTNGDSDFGWAFLATALFGALGTVLLAVTFEVVDLLTPGRLGEVLVEPGTASPLAYVTAASLLAMSGIICASIA